MKKRDKNYLDFPVISEETLQNNPKFLWQVYDHRGKVLNDAVLSQCLSMTSRLDSCIWAWPISIRIEWSDS